MEGEAGGGALDDPLGWVRAVARRVARRTGTWEELDELVGLGAEGLVVAGRRFDAGRGVPFAAYARPRVEGAMLDGLRAAAARRHSLPRSARGGEPGEPFRARFVSARSDGLLAATAPDEDGPVATAPAHEAPEAMAVRGELRRLLAAALADLPEDERALAVRHGLADEPLAEVAARLGLAPARARQLYGRALLRLRSRLRAAL